MVSEQIRLWFPFYYTLEIVYPFEDCDPSAHNLKKLFEIPCAVTNTRDKLKTKKHAVQVVFNFIKSTDWDMPV